jgi:hypothetical protein
MSFLIDTAESMLHLTDAEKAVVNAALPTLAEDVQAINDHQDQLRAAYALIVKAAPVVYRILDDWKTLGPVLHDILAGTGSIFSIGGAVNGAKDIQATVAANPYLVTEGQKLYNALLPLFVKLNADWPKIAPALQIIMSKAGGASG